MPGFTGVISDLGNASASMYKLRCKSPQSRTQAQQGPQARPDSPSRISAAMGLTRPPAARLAQPMPRRPAETAARRAMANRWGLRSRKVRVTASLPHRVLGRAPLRVNRLANPPTRARPRLAQALSSRAPNPPLRAASPRQKGMVPSDRLGEFPDWKAIEIKKATG